MAGALLDFTTGGGGRVDAGGAQAPAILAVDPGREKCGVAVVDASGRIAFRAVVDSGVLLDRLAELIDRHPHPVLILGDRTGSRHWRRRIEAALGPRLGGIELVDEHLSTFEARQRYLADHPARGWRRLVPRPFRLPDRPVDDYVAVILAERYRRRQVRRD